MTIRRHFCSSALTAFVAVAETGGIANAARRLHVTPSAVSKRLQLLERDFGRELIERSVKPIIITPVGTRLLHVIKQIREVQESLLGDLGREDAEMADGQLQRRRDSLTLVERMRELLDASSLQGAHPARA